MAISFVGSNTNSGNNGGDVSVALTGIALVPNDLVVVSYTCGDNDNVDETMAMTTSGYTKVADLFANDDIDTNFGVFWKVMSATTDTAAVVTGVGGNDVGVSAVAMAFRGVDTVTPMDVAPTTATGVNTNIPNPPSITHSGDAGVWVVACAGFGHTGGAVVSMAAPSGYANGASDSGNDTSDSCTGMATLSSPSNPEDPGTFTPSIADSAANSWCAATLALRPAATPAGSGAGYYQHYYGRVVLS